MTHLRDAAAALARRDRERMDEPDEAVLGMTRHIYNVATPHLSAAISLLNRPSPWAEAEVELAEALVHAEAALAALEKVNLRLDRYGWSA